MGTFTDNIYSYIDKVKDTLRENKDDLNTFKRAMPFMGKLRVSLLKEQDVHEQIIQLLTDFGTGSIGREEVAKKAKEILKGHDDLLAEFNTFFPSGYGIDIAEDDIDNEEPIGLKEEAIKFLKIVKERHPDKYEDFLKALNMYWHGKMDIVKVWHELSGILNDSCDLFKVFDKFLKPRDSHIKYGVQVTPSYKLLPIKSKKTSEVIDYTCVCVTKNSFSSRPPRTPYEGCMKDIEEKIFDAGMKREILDLAIGKAKKLLEEDNCDIIDKEKKVDLEKHLTPMGLKYMKEFCHNHGIQLEVMNMYYRDTQKIFPLIIKKLEYEQEKVQKVQKYLEQEYERMARAKSSPKLKRKYKA